MSAAIAVAHTSGLNRIHPFERAGFGHAPYRCTGSDRRVYYAAPDAPAQPGASCNYCGTGIMDVYHVVSADGCSFVVGSDCVRRVWQEFDATIPPDFRAEFTRIERAKREIQRQARQARLDERCRRATATLDGMPGLFADQCHPYEVRAARGETMRDYVTFCLTGWSQANRTWACRQVEQGATQQCCRDSQ